MPSNTENVKLGVCSVTYGGEDLGYTQGGVDGTVSTTTREVKVDQFGDSPINEYIMGRTCMVKVPLAETTLQNLVRIMPGATMVKSGGAKATGTITVSAVPEAADSVTVNGVDLVFETAPDALNEVAIPASVDATAAAIASWINNSTDSDLVYLKATAAAGVVTVTTDEDGVFGNAVTLVVDGSGFAVVAMAGGTDPTDVSVNVPNGIGISLLSLAKKLVLHPVALPAEDKSEDFVIPLAGTPGAMQFSFKLDQERLYPVEFKAYPDPATKRLFYVGDQ